MCYNSLFLLSLYSDLPHGLSFAALVSPTVPWSSSPLPSTCQSEPSHLPSPWLQTTIQNWVTRHYLRSKKKHQTSSPFLQNLLQRKNVKQVICKYVKCLCIIYMYFPNIWYTQSGIWKFIKLKFPKCPPPPPKKNVCMFMTMTWIYSIFYFVWLRTLLNYDDIFTPI